MNNDYEFGYDDIPEEPDYDDMCDDDDDCDDDDYNDDDDGPMSYPQEGDDYMVDGVGFADPGGRSALRAATKSKPRNLPCPTCNRPNMLTPADRRQGYQCDICADADEGGYGY